MAMYTLYGVMHFNLLGISQEHPIFGHVLIQQSIVHAQKRSERLDGLQVFDSETSTSFDISDFFQIPQIETLVLRTIHWPTKVKTHTSGVSSSFPWQSGGGPAVSPEVWSSPVVSIISASTSLWMVYNGKILQTWILHGSGNLYLDQIRFSNDTSGAHEQFQYLSDWNSAPTKVSNFRRNDMVINGTTILRCLSLLVQNPPDEKESHKTTLFWGGNKV